MSRPSGPLTFALTILLMLLPAASALGQIPAAGDTGSLEARIRKIDAEIAELEAIKRQIEVDHHVLLVTAQGVVLATPQQVGNLFGHAVLTDQLNPDGILESIETIKGMTRIYLRDIIEPGLEDLRKQRAEAAGQLAQHTNPRPPPAPPTTPQWMQDSIAARNARAALTPPTWRGRLQGTWQFFCRYKDGRELPIRGPFIVDFPGDGTLNGWYEMEGGQYAVNGTINQVGAASGRGENSYGIFYWDGVFRVVEGELWSESGYRVVSFRSNEPDASCTGGSWTPGPPS